MELYAIKNLKTGQYVHSSRGYCYKSKKMVQAAYDKFGNNKSLYKIVVLKESDQPFVAEESPIVYSCGCGFLNGEDIFFAAQIQLQTRGEDLLCPLCKTKIYKHEKKEPSNIPN